MDVAMQAEAQALNDKLQSFLEAELRERFPYLKIDIVHSVTAQCGTLVEDVILEQ